MPNPWVAVEATVRRSDKLAALPSDTARWGWLVMLGEAKLLRRQGTFTPGQWTELMGRFGKYRQDYVDAGLLHVSPTFCTLDRRPVCLRDRGPFPRGTLVVHDWPRHQREHALRQAEYESRQTDTPTDAETDIQTDVLTDLSPPPPTDIYSRAGVGTETGTETKTELSKAPTAIAVGNPRASSPTNEPRLTREQLDSWSNFGKEWNRFKEAWLARGMLYAPFGSPDDDDTSQRGLLYQVLDARPNDIVQWVREAPLPTSREVITYILERWHEAREEAGVEDDEWQEAKVEDRRTAVTSMTHIGEILGTRP